MARFGCLFALAVVALLACVHGCVAQGPSTTTHVNTNTPGELRWFSFGDWGGVGFVDSLQQKAVEGQMHDKAKTFLPDVMITCGDNFYNSGVTSTTDKQWQTSWLDVYDHHTLEKPWYSVLGNHDYIDNPQAQVEYSQQGLGGGRWHMPARYYSQTFEFDNQTAQFVFIDTIMLASATTMRVADEELASGEITAEQHRRLAANLHADAVPYNGTLQLEWIKTTLATSTADWLFVVGHFPVYSGGDHGSTPELQEQVKPLLEQYNVDAYLDGHDHTLQALYSNGVHYYVTGAASLMSSTMHKLPQTLYGKGDILGFAAMSISGSTMSMEYIDEFGTKVYSLSQTVRPKTRRV